VKFYESTATIEATPEVVLSILTDGPGYPTWDSGVEGCRGPDRRRGADQVHSEVSPGRAFPVRVRLGEDGHAMTWTGGMPLGLFRGVRTFTLEPTDQGGYRVQDA